MLGFQVRSPGAPGPLTLKEVEELEQLTQQLMEDMEHPQKQNVAVSGEPTAHPLGCLPLHDCVAAYPLTEPADPLQAYVLPPIYFNITCPSQSPVAGVTSPWHVHSPQFALWGSCSTSHALPVTSVSGSCKDSSFTAWRGRRTVRAAIL